MPDVSLTFPDGSVREYDAATTGAALARIDLQVARQEGRRLLRIDGIVRDLADPLGNVRQDRDRHPRRPARAGAHPP